MTVEAIDQRILKEDYRNYDLIARYWRGCYCGRIWKKGEKFDAFEGDSLEEIIQAMRNVVDRRINDKIAKRHNKNVTLKELIAAFNTIQSKLSFEQVQLLDAHAAAPKRKINILKLQKVGGYSSSTETMLQYANIGNRLINELGLLPSAPSSIDPALAIMLEVKETSCHNESGEWVMRPDIAKAYLKNVNAGRRKESIHSGYRFA